MGPNGTSAGSGSLVARDVSCVVRFRYDHRSALILGWFDK